MNEAAPDAKTPSAEQPAGKPQWSRPAFETLAFEQTLNFASNTQDTTPASRS